MKYKLLHCQCHSPYHSLQIMGIKEDKELLICVQLKTGNLFQRLKIALGYIFRGECQGYDEVILGRESIKELQEVIDSVK